MVVGILVGGVGVAAGRPTASMGRITKIGRRCLGHWTMTPVQKWGTQWSWARTAGMEKEAVKAAAVS